MNKLGTVAVIRHNGSSVIYDNNRNGYSDELMRRMVVSEMKRNEEQYTREKSWNESIVSKRNESRAKRLNEIKNAVYNPVRKGIVTKITESIDFIYACIIVWSEEFSLIKRIEDDEDMWW